MCETGSVFKGEEMALSKKIIFGILILLSQTALADFKEDIDCLAKNIYFESRNQPWVGKIAVAQVTLNRVESMLFPSKICEVVEQIKAPQRCQFSWFCDGKSDEPFDKVEWSNSIEAALLVYPGHLPDVTEGALWYHADYIIKPRWAKHYKETVRINEHIFYRTN